VKISIQKNRIQIEPETDFETEWCQTFIPQGESGVAWLKCGLSAADVEGIIIECDKNE
jgi:hypothetical protein